MLGIIIKGGLMSLFQRAIIVIYILISFLFVYFNRQLYVYNFLLLSIILFLVFSDRIKSVRLGQIFIEMRRIKSKVEQNYLESQSKQISSSQTNFPVIVVKRCKKIANAKKRIFCVVKQIEIALVKICDKWEYSGKKTIIFMTKFLKGKNRVNWPIYDSLYQIDKLIKKITSNQSVVDDVFIHEIESLVDIVNKSMQFGYSLNITKNKNYKTQGAFCEYEHCIEVMPVKKITDENSCPKYGHDCPGGEKQVDKCKKMGRFGKR